MATYRQALSLQPDSFQGLFGAADSSRELRKYQSALGFYDSAIKVDPLRPDVWNNRALALIEMKRYREAEESLRRALGIWPGHAHALANLGKLLAGQQRYEEAVALSEKALDIQPGYVLALHVKAFSLLKSQNYPRASESYRRILELDPGNVAAMAQLGIAELAFGNLKEAEFFLRSAFNKGYRRAVMSAHLGTLRLKQSDYRAAYRLLRRGFLFSGDPPTRALACTNLAFIACQTHRFRRGAALANLAVDLSPELASAWNILGVCLAELGVQDRAGKALERAVQLDPNNGAFAGNLMEFRKKVSAHSP